MGAPGARERPLRILVAGGGTGGHLFPGLAIAEALRRRVPQAELRFAGSAYGIEHRAVPERGYRLHRIAVRGLYGVPIGRRLLRLAMLPWAFVQCVALLLGYRPRLVIGVGGYASGPVLATALLLQRSGLLRGLRCVLQEQNAYPGVTNRLLGRYVSAAFTPVADHDGFFRRPIVTGTPVRAEIRALRDRLAADRTPPDRTVPLLLVLGGSQGARVINEALLAALPRLAAWGRQLRILHQTGAASLDAVREAYARQPAGSALRIEAEAFIADMATAYRDARLVVSRAGASAVNEIVTARRAAIFVPIPGTSGDHQRRNALRIVEAGAARMIEQAVLTGESLAAAVLGLLDDPAALDAMETATDALDPGDAAGRIADECLRLIAWSD